MQKVGAYKPSPLPLTRPNKVNDVPKLLVGLILGNLAERFHQSPVMPRMKLAIMNGEALPELVSLNLIISGYGSHVGQLVPEGHDLSIT